MARPTWTVVGALAVCGIVAALSGVGAATTTVVSFLIDDDYQGTSGQRVRSDGKGAYADYRIPPDPPDFTLNWCVDAEPATTGNLFVRLNRKLDGEAGVLRCSKNPDSSGTGALGVPRTFTMTIADKVVCDQLATDSEAGLPVTDSAITPETWNPATSSLPCTLPGNDNLRIRLETLYKTKAKTTILDFQTAMFDKPASYVIQSDGVADIISVTSSTKVVTYPDPRTFHLVRYAPGVKAKTVGPSFTMPVKITFTTTALQ